MNVLRHHTVGLSTLLVFVGALSATTHADDPTTPTDPSILAATAVVQQYYTAQRTSDQKAMAACYADDIVKTDKDSVTRGKDALVESDADYAKTLREFKRKGGQVTAYSDIAHTQKIGDDAVLVIEEYYMAVQSNGRYTGKQVGYDVYVLSQHGEQWSINSITDTNRVTKSRVPTDEEIRIIREIQATAIGNAGENIRRLLKSAGK